MYFQLNFRSQSLSVLFSIVLRLTDNTISGKNCFISLLRPLLCGFYFTYTGICRSVLHIQERRVSTWLSNWLDILGRCCPLVWRDLPGSLRSEQQCLCNNNSNNNMQFLTVHLGRVLLMSDFLILVWGHSVHFAKFPMLRFSKGYCSPSFHSISTKFYCKYVGHEGIQPVTVFADLPK